MIGPMRKMDQWKNEMSNRWTERFCRLQESCDVLMSSWCNHSFAVQVRDLTGNLPSKVSWYSSQWIFWWKTNYLIDSGYVYVLYLLKCKSGERATNKSPQCSVFVLVLANRSPVKIIRIMTENLSFVHDVDYTAF